MRGESRERPLYDEMIRRNDGRRQGRCQDNEASRSAIRHKKLTEVVSSPISKFDSSSIICCPLCELFAFLLRDRCSGLFEPR